MCTLPLRVNTNVVAHYTIKGEFDQRIQLCQPFHIHRVWTIWRNHSAIIIERLGKNGAIDVLTYIPQMYHLIEIREVFGMHRVYGLANVFLGGGCCSNQRAQQSEKEEALPYFGVHDVKRIG